MLKQVFGALIVFIGVQSNLLAWNAVGHRVVAQIAYDELTPHAKSTFDRYNHALDKIYKPQSFVNAAVWLDTLRYQSIAWFATMHYIDIAFSEDGTPLPATDAINAVWAIDNAKAVLANKYATSFDKGIAFRILIHVVGDLHQPLHAATRVSRALPGGDRGGNLFPLQANPVAKNLHAYWDKGAGFLTVKKNNHALKIATIVAQLEHQWPCATLELDMNPSTWAKESNTLAVLNVYKPLMDGASIDKAYQRAAKKIAAKRIAWAGCRLGTLLNQLDAHLKG